MEVEGKCAVMIFSQSSINGNGMWVEHSSLQVSNYSYPGIEFGEWDESVIGKEKQKSNQL